MFQLILIWTFWVSFGLGVFVYFIYPVFLGILSAILGSSFHVKIPSTDDEWPDVAYLIACFNEEKEIVAKLRNVTELDYPRDKLLILILNDGSKDATVKLAREFIDSHPDLRTEILDFEDNRGKSTVLLRGVEWLIDNHPEVKILAFTDANAHWAKDALKRLVAPFSNEKIGSVCGILKYVNPEGAAAGHIEGLYWRYEALLKSLSSRLGTLPGAIGSIFAMRTDAYNPLTETRGDDFELPVLAIIGGYKSILVQEAISYEPPSMDFITEYRRKLRITGQMIPSALMLFCKAIIKGRLLIAFQLLSHKLLRYLVPFYMIFMLASSALLWNTGLFYTVVFLFQLMFYILALFGLLVERTGNRPPKPLQIPLYFTMVNVASLVSILRTITGQRIHWERNR